MCTLSCYDKMVTPTDSPVLVSDDRPLTFKELRLQRQRNTSVGVDAEGNPLIQGVKAENDAVKVEEVNMQSGREAAGTFLTVLLCVGVSVKFEYVT